AERAEIRARLVAEAGSRLDRSLDFEQTVETLAKLPVPWIADWSAVYQVMQDGSITQLAVSHADGSNEALVAQIDRLYPFRIDQPVGIGQVVRTGESLLLREI